MKQNNLEEINQKQNNTLKVKAKSIDDIDFCVIVYLLGYIDPQNSNILKREIDRCISEGMINFIFDFEDITHISSQSIGLFSHLKDSIRPYNGTVAFYGLNPSVFELFSLLGFYDYFIVTNDVYESIDEILNIDHTEKETVIEYYPKSFRCPICSVRLKASKAGIYNCSKCKTRLKLETKGEIKLG